MSAMVPGAWHQVPVTWCQVSGTRYQVPGTRHLVPGARYLGGLHVNLSVFLFEHSKLNSRSGPWPQHRWQNDKIHQGHVSKGKYFCLGLLRISYTQLRSKLSKYTAAIALILSFGQSRLDRRWWRYFMHLREAWLEPLGLLVKGHKYHGLTVVNSFQKTALRMVCML